MKPLSEFLMGTAIKPLLENSNRLLHLNDLLSKLIKDEWTKYCVIANFEKGILTLATSNPGWATRIRFLLPEVTKTLSIHSEFSQLQQIKCKMITVNAPIETDHPKRMLSAFAKDLLLETANSIQNSNLKNSLTKLAAHFSEE